MRMSWIANWKTAATALALTGALVTLAGPAAADPVTEFNFSNPTDKPAAIVIDGKINCVAEGGQQHGSECTVRADCSDVDQDAAHICVAAALAPGSHALEITTMNQTVKRSFEIRAAPPRPAGFPPLNFDYDGNCALNTGAAQPTVTCDGDQ